MFATRAIARRKTCEGRDSNRSKTVAHFVRAASCRIRILRAFSRLSRPFEPKNARGGIRTHGPLRERILSPPPLSRLGHPRAADSRMPRRMDVSVDTGAVATTNRRRASRRRSDRARSPRSSVDRRRGSRRGPFSPDTSPRRRRCVRDRTRRRSRPLALRSRSRCPSPSSPRPRRTCRPRCICSPRR